MKVENEISAIATGTDVVHVAAPNVRDAAVRSRNSPTGLALLAAYRSAAQPQKKYPMPHVSGGIQANWFTSTCVSPSRPVRYSDRIVKTGPGEIAGNA